MLAHLFGEANGRTMAPPAHNSTNASTGATNSGLWSAPNGWRTSQRDRRLRAQTRRMAVFMGRSRSKRSRIDW